MPPKLQQVVQQIINVNQLQKDATVPKAYFDPQPCSIPSAEKKQEVLVHTDVTQANKFIMHTTYPGIDLVFNLDHLMNQIENNDFKNPAFGPGMRFFGVRARFTDLQVQRIKEEVQCRKSFQSLSLSHSFSNLVLAPLMRVFTRRVPHQVETWLHLNVLDTYWMRNIDVVSDEVLIQTLSTNHTVLTFLSELETKIKTFADFWFLSKRMLQRKQAYSEDLNKCSDYRCLWTTLLSEFKLRWMEQILDQVLLPFKQLPRDFEQRLAFGLQRENIVVLQTEPVKLFCQVYTDFSSFVLFFYWGLFSELLDSKIGTRLFIDLDIPLKTGKRGMSLSDQMTIVQQLLTDSETKDFLSFTMDETVRLVNQALG